MKFAAFQALYCLLLCSMVFVSCQKDNSTTPGPTSPPITGTMTLSTPIDSSYELIVSETNGKILYDSLFMSHTTITATLHTNEALVDVTLLRHNQTRGIFAFAWKGVNPSTWQTVFTGSFWVPRTLPVTTSNSKITYTNLPPSSDFGSAASPVFSNFVDQGSLQWVYSVSPSYCSISFTQYGKNPDYLLLPTLALYNLHTPVGLNDTVDLSHMDAAVKLNLNKPAQYPMLANCSLTGYRDTTDFSNCTQFYFYSNTQANKPAADLEYPPVPVQKYELWVGLTNSNKESINYYSYQDTIPHTVPVYSASDYNITSRLNDNFAISFNSIKPSYYRADFTSGSMAAPVYVTIYASPDSTTLHPLSFLKSLNSQTLRGVDLSTLSATMLWIENTGGLNYADYQAYVQNTGLLKTKRVAYSVQYSKSF